MERRNDQLTNTLVAKVVDQNEEIEVLIAHILLQPPDPLGTGVKFVIKFVIVNFNLT